MFLSSYGVIVQGNLLLVILQYSVVIDHYPISELSRAGVTALVRVPAYSIEG